MALDPISSGIDLVNTIVSRIWPDKTEEEKAKLAQALQLAQMAASAVSDQVAVNKAEAASGSVFVAGWRPFLGWVCGGAFAYMLLARPILPWIVTVFGSHPVPPLPAVDLTDVIMILGGMLGIGTMRTVEKINGVAAGPH